MSNINALIVRAKNRQYLFDEVCRIAVEHGGFGFFARISLLDHSTRGLIPAACVGGDAAPVMVLNRSSVGTDSRLGQGPSARALREKRVVFSNDLTADTSPENPRRLTAWTYGNFRSGYAIQRHRFIVARRGAHGFHRIYRGTRARGLCGRHAFYRQGNCREKTCLD